MGAFGSINATTQTEAARQVPSLRRTDRDRKGKRRPWNRKLVAGHSQSQRVEQRHLHDYRGNNKLPDHTDNRGGRCGKPGERYVCGQFQPDQRQRFILGRSHAVAIRAANQRREVLRGLPFFVSGPSIASERRRQAGREKGTDLFLRPSGRPLPRCSTRMLSFRAISSAKRCVPVSSAVQEIVSSKHRPADSRAAPSGRGRRSSAPIRARAPLGDRQVPEAPCHRRDDLSRAVSSPPAWSWSLRCRISPRIGTSPGDPSRALHRSSVRRVRDAAAPWAIGAISVERSHAAGRSRVNSSAAGSALALRPRGITLSVRHRLWYASHRANDGRRTESTGDAPRRRRVW